LYQGESQYQVTDLTIPGRGINWQMTRAYRSSMLTAGPLGHNWQFSYQRQLMVVTPQDLTEIQGSFPNAKVGDVVRLDGLDRADLYVLNPDGSYTAPAGFFTSLVKNMDGSYAERDYTGDVVDYTPVANDGISQMTSLTDRDDNSLHFIYDSEGRLTDVIDTMGRDIVYIYDSLSQLTEIQDFTGRELLYQYDSQGDLISETSPAVTGTPDGNDFPQGKTERYTYSSGFSNELLNRELLTITAPNEVASGGPPRVTYTYDTNPLHATAGAVTSLREGGTNQSGVAAGGTIKYQYDVLGTAPHGDFATLVFQTTATDRNGNITQYDFNQRGNIVEMREFNNRNIRPSDPPFYDTTYQYDGDYHLLKETMPLGNALQYLYDSSNPDRLEQGNLLSVTETPDSTRGGDQTSIVTTYTYEPIYNQVHTMTEARGNDPSYVPPNGDPNSPSRYTTVYTYDYQEGTDFTDLGTILNMTGAQVQALLATAGIPMGLGDINGDGLTNGLTGNLIRTDHPSVQLLPGSNEATIEAVNLREAGTSTGANSNSTGPNTFTTLNDTTQAWVLNQWAGRTVIITSGTGAGQTATISSNSPTQLVLSTTWTTIPDATSTYVILPVPAAQNGTSSGSNTATTLNDLTQSWTVNQWVGHTVAITSGTGAGQLARITANTANQLTVSTPWTTTPDATSSYAILDINSLQPSVELATFNVLEQISSQTDPEGNVNTYTYYSEIDPDGDGDTDTPGRNPTTGGYLAQTNQDTVSAPNRDSGTNPTPTNIQHQYFYDEVGNVIRDVDGRGIATDYAVNQLNQVVQVTRASAHNVFTPGVTEPLPLTDFQYLTRYFYDYNNNLVLTEVEDRGNTSNVDGNPPVADQPALNVQLTSTSTGGNTATTLNDTKQTWTTNQWAGFEVKITSGTGVGQVRTILSNTATQLTLTTAWTTIPNTTSTYAIYPLLNPDPVGGTAFQDTVYKYDILDQQLEMLQEVTNGATPLFLRTRYRYDPNGNQVLTIEPEGNATASFYDERDLLFQSTRGATAPPPKTLLGPGDPTSYDVRGGLPATTTYNYDLNGNLIETVAADDTDSSLANNSKLPSGTSTGSNTATTLNDTTRTWMPNQWEGRTVLIVSGTGAGQLRTIASNTANKLTVTSAWTTTPDSTSVYAFQGDRTRYIYDGFDRQVSVVDSVGNQTVTQYDPAGNVVRTSHFGPTGGASPTSDGPDTLPGPVSSGGVIQSANLVNPSTSVLLSSTEYSYDELGRTFQTSQVLFVNTIPTQRPPDVAEGASDIGKGGLTPGQNQAIPGIPNILASGTSTGSNSATTLNDTTQSWTTNQWASRAIQITGGTGAGQVRTIQGNSATQLTLDTPWSTIPDATSTYVITLISGRVSDRTEYDRDSRVTFTVMDDLDTTHTFYDGASRVIETVDPVGNTVETAYDGNNNVIEARETDVAQVAGVANEIFLTTNFYDSLNRLQQTVDNLGQTTYYRYDSRDNLVAMADANGPLTGATITRRAFPDGPKTVDAINNFGNVTLYFYDGIDRQIRQDQILTASGQGDGNHIGASIFGVKDDTTAPESFPPTPDPTQGGGDGIIRTGTVYDKNSLTSALIDDQGNVTLYLYDNLDRKVAETKGVTVNSMITNATILGSRVIMTPTAATINNPAAISAGKINTQLSEIKSGLTAVASLFPSLADRVDDHPPTTIVTGYDPNGNVLILSDENNSYVYTLYDAISRPIAVRVFRAGQSDSFAGDPIFAPAPVSLPTHHSLDDEKKFPPVVGTTIQNFQYDGLSRMTMGFDNNDPTTTADDSTVTDAYDSLSRIIEETQQIGSLPPRAIDSAWRAENLRKSLTYPNGRVEEYTYDGLDRLATVKDQGAAQDIADYKYIGVDRVLERDYPINGTRETYLDNTGTLDIGYDGLRRPIEERDLRSDNSLIVGFTYIYDRMNNKLTEGKLHDPTNSEVYTYDSAYRLISFHRPAAGSVTPLQQTWTLDGVGNWKQVDGETRKHSSFNEITSRTTGSTTTNILSDDNGNEIDDGTYVYTYDFENRLRTVTRKSDGALIADYSYDADGRRIQKVVTNTTGLNGTTDYYLDGWQEIEEHNAADAPTQQYVFGSYIDEPLIADTNLTSTPTRLFYNQNTLYSVYALTDVTGKIVEGYLYDAYGRQTVYDPGISGFVTFGAGDKITPGGNSLVGNPFMFTGRRLDPELTRTDPQTGQKTGIYYYRARYMDTVQGRFLQRDPMTLPGGMNSYAYVKDDPTKNSDPIGLQTTSCDSLCGPDITAQLYSLKGAVWGRFRMAPWWLKLSACVWDMLFEVQELHTSGSVRGRQGACPTHDCSDTVWMFNSCVKAYEANYFLSGVIVRLCELTNLNFENPGPYISIYIWKAVNGTFRAEYASPWTAEMWHVYRNSMWAYSAGNQKAFPASVPSAPYAQTHCRYCEKWKGTFHWYWQGIQQVEHMYLPGRGVSATSPFV
jgi:RHS repeat-associated protein